ncbi:thiamine pyrophosphate-dependent enzyme, partial [Klebsiella pneumoniae]|uniref:thiamine pyrophosphate-dependent enzyme n=1 Tax=Klebsiella pneumoniae TaxID=573 RepID=UPI001E5F07A1
NRAENTYHVEYGYSCMGYEVNAALGVKLAQPQSEVYSLVGDGETRFIESGPVTSQLQEVLHLFNLVVGTEEEFHIAGGST